MFAEIECWWSESEVLTRNLLATVQNGGAGESSRRLKLAARNGVFW
jgi:hypothetical protein